jgi:tetratricopeptide (TPR) repeat protein
MAQHLDPDNAPVQAQLGKIYSQQGNGAAAEEHYLQALRLKPEYTEARRQLADLYEQRGDLASALEQLKTMAATQPPDWSLTDRIGRLSIKANQPEAAVTYYRKWLNHGPANEKEAEAALSFAKTRLAGKKLRDDNLISQGEAKRYAEQAVKYQPDNFEARLIDAKLGQRIGEPTVPSAKDPALVDVALQQPTYSPHQSFERGQLLLARFQFDAAEDAFRTARRSDPSPRGQMTFGELFLTQGLPAMAEEAFQQVLRQLPENDSARLGLAEARDARQHSDALVAEARLHWQRDQVDIAIQKVKEALRVDAMNDDGYYLLAQLVEKRKDYAQAADYYYAYLQLHPMSEDAPRIRRKIESLKAKLAKQ